MNIFVLSEDPRECARFHNDRHVVKMILETCQLMSTAHVFLDGERTAKARVPLILRPTHVNHPVAIWVRQTAENYNWAGELLRNLCLEYNQRYGKVHSYVTNGLVARLMLHRPMNMQHGQRTPFAQCMPAQYRRASAVEAYRLYYFHEKWHMDSWRAPARTPQWWLDMKKEQLIGAPKEREFYPATPIARSKRKNA